MPDKAFLNDQLAVILILVIHIHPGAYAVYTSMAGILPEAHIIIVVTGRGILRHPFVPAYNTELTGKEIFVGVDHGIIPCRINGSAESIGNINQLLVGKIFMALVLQVKYNRVINGVRRDPLQHQVCFFHGLLRRNRIRIQVNSRLNAGSLRSCNVCSKLRIHTAFGTAHLNKCKVDSGCSHLSPADRSVMLGYINSSCDGSAWGYSLCILYWEQTKKSRCRNKCHCSFCP